MSLKAVKNKIKSIDKTRQVTRAMEAVSAVKMRKSQALALGTRPYALSALRILETISGSIDAIHHPLLSTRPVKKTLVVVVSADKGLAGSFGAALLKNAYRFFGEHNLTSENTLLVCIGKKAKEHFAKRGWNIVAHYERWSDAINFSNVKPLADIVSDGFMKGDFDAAHIVYTHFVSTLKQKVYSRKLLPVTYESVQEIVKGILPETGKYSGAGANDAAPIKEISFEPSAEAILGELVPMLFNIQIYHSILESNASEHSARMLAMKNASDNARDISKGLKLHFNKVRQAAITREVSEIVGGMESMRVVDV
jgi:F-type H+-transporting ATPase subunit gamma